MGKKKHKEEHSRKNQNRINVKYIEVYMLSLVVFLGYKQIGLPLCGCVSVWVCLLAAHTNTRTARTSKQTNNRSFNHSISRSVRPLVVQFISTLIHRYYQLKFN